ncbi:serine/threonine-protein kinase Nek10-like isoform X2 [Lineus longissimus]|uniref:serine/threonine-protein kinase Nek10-like isoform X2 n=1 Tax=Lineus longissimus TaxID=88925 RepID=UPI00315D0477
MPSQGKSASSPNHEQDIKELCRLLSLINTPASKQQLPSIQIEGPSLNKSFQWPLPLPKSGAQQHQSTEALALEKFSHRYQNERHFSTHPNHDYFSQIFSALVKQRLCCSDWTLRAPPENILRVLVCLRIMTRDLNYQKDFFQADGVKVLSEHLQRATDSYLFYGDGPFVVDILKEMTNIFQKLSTIVDQRQWLVACNAHKALVLLLSSNDVIVLHCTLHALISLAQSKEPRVMIGELNSIEMVLRILQDYDNLSKKLAANLLRTLCADSQAREMVKIYDGIPLLLSLLHSDNIKLLWNVVWCLVQLAEDQDASNDIRTMGGIPLLLSLLHDRKFVNERPSSANSASSAPPHGRTPPTGVPMEEGEDMREHVLSLKSACCAALTELVLNDTNAQQIVQANGVFSIGLLILPQLTNLDKDRKAVENLQKNAFRALRFLFSMERNRRLFKRLFPPELYEMFIRCGHYVRELNTYKPVVEKLNSLPEDTIAEIQENVLALNQNKTPSRFIGDYAVLEHLGSGAFGSVYKVKKKAHGQSFLAMKEINTVSSSFGKSAKERDKSIGEIISELTIIKEQMRHPNVVRYYKTFVECDKLYIVMELIEGAPLGEHFSSLKEKGEKFQEDRIWNIFIQLTLALRYLHKDKGIVHRDLTPNNIMLGENDRVTITDFGLAKQKRSDCSKMTSVVGTILYNCPEIVQYHPYGEKADIWAIGCILYQMCTLQPPFMGSNMLALVLKIVSAEYDPLPPGEYSERMEQTIRSCITVDPNARPDICEVAGQISDIILRHMDILRVHQFAMEKKLERERKRTQRHYFEANRNMQNYHRLFLVSQERYDKLVNLASSGGGSSMKDGELSDADGVFSDVDSTGSRGKRRIHKTSGSSRSDNEDNTNDKGWTSDDDFESFESFSSNSRGSSAGSSRSLELSGTLKADGETTFALPKPPIPSRRRDRRQKLDEELTVDIPNNSPNSSNSAKLLNISAVSRDSGLSSGDPSPNTTSLSFPDASPQGKPPSVVSRSISSTESGAVTRRVSSAKTRPTHLKTKRSLSTGSANTATLTISPRKVRQINDPILQMLNQLHKIIYTSQLPPTLCHNPRRRVIERFKRALFAPQSTSFNLKNELKKLLTGSRELIDLNFGPSESPLVNREASRDPEVLTLNAEKGGGLDTDHKDIGITYESMQGIIESVLVESGYYDMSPAARHSRTNPLGGPHIRAHTER